MAERLISACTFHCNLTARRWALKGAFQPVLAWCELYMQCWLGSWSAWPEQAAWCMTPQTGWSQTTCGETSFKPLNQKGISPGKPACVATQAPKAGQPVQIDSTHRVDEPGEEPRPLGSRRGRRATGATCPPGLWTTRGGGTTGSPHWCELPAGRPLRPGGPAA